jgi:hypothetical protein
VRSHSARATALSLALPALAALLFSPTARAGVVYDYAFSGSSNSITCCASYTYGEQYSSYTQTVDISGSFVWDVSSQSVSSVDITLSTAPDSNIMFSGSSMNFGTIAYQSAAGGSYFIDVADANGDTEQFLFDYTTGLNSGLSVALDPGVYYTNYGVNTPGLFFPVYNYYAQNQLVPVANTTEGYADPVSTPEPASIALFVTGLIGLAALRRRST